MNTKLNNKKPWLLALTTCASLSFAASAQAATLTLTDTIPLVNDNNNVINILKFDTANDIDPGPGAANSTVGATLNSVTMTVTVALSDAVVRLDNDGDDPSTGTGRVNNQVNSFTVGNVTADPLDGVDLGINVQQDFNLESTVGDDTSKFTVTNDVDFAEFAPGTVEGQTTGGFTGALADSAGYTTTTANEVIVFTLNSSFLTSATFVGGLGRFDGTTPSATYDVEVVYDYTIPEPSIAMLGGLGLLGLFRRRRS